MILALSEEQTEIQQLRAEVARLREVRMLFYKIK